MLGNKRPRVALSIRRNGGAIGFYVWWDWCRRDSWPASSTRMIGIVLGLLEVSCEWPNPHFRTEFQPSDLEVVVRRLDEHFQRNMER